MKSSKRPTMGPGRGQAPSPPPPIPSIPASHQRSSFETFLDTSGSSLSSSASSSSSSQLATPIAPTHNHIPSNPRPQAIQPGYFDPTFHIPDNSGEQTPTQQTQLSSSTAPQAVAAQTTMLSHTRKRSGTGDNAPSTSAPGITLSREAPTPASSSSNTLTGSPTPTSKKEGSSKMKLFSSKPARIGTPPADKSKKPLPSPNKLPNISSPIPRIVNFHHDQSSKSESRSASRKGSFSGSGVTLLGGSVPIDIVGLGLPQPAFAAGTSLYSSSPPSSSNAIVKEGFHKSHFLRPKKDGHGLTLSSASSNSKFINADAQSIYSFGPSSPSGAAFALQGKDGKGHHGHGGSRGEAELSGSGADWQLVRKHVLHLFEGEALRTPVEEMNRAVSNHIQRCINHTSSVALIDDVRDLLDTGMLSIDPTLRSWPEERLVPRLIEIWLFVFGNVLPYFEAVFLPLQQEFKGVGTIMTTREARDFWGALGVENGGIGILDVRRLALISFRDNIILPIHSRLRSIFMSTIHLDLTSDPHSTQTVARMLQCISVVASVLSGDEHQSKIDELAKTLKHNWLGRGRAGRNRRGFVGFKMRAPVLSAASTGSPSGSVVGTPALGSPAVIYEAGKRDGMVGMKGLGMGMGMGMSENNAD